MPKKIYPSEQQERFIVRLPDGMRDKLKAAASDNNRSMNAEIVARLEISDDVEQVMLDRDLALERLEGMQNRTAEYKQTIEMLREALDQANARNEHLLDILENRLGVKE